MRFAIAESNGLFAHLFGLLQSSDSRQVSLSPLCVAIRNILLERQLPNLISLEFIFSNKNFGWVTKACQLLTQCLSDTGLMGTPIISEYHLKDLLHKAQILFDAWQFAARLQDWIAIRPFIHTISRILDSSVEGPKTFKSISMSWNTHMFVLMCVLVGLQRTVFLVVRPLKNPAPKWRNNYPIEVYKWLVIL